MMIWNWKSIRYRGGWRWVTAVAQAVVGLTVTAAPTLPADVVCTSLTMVAPQRTLSLSEPDRTVDVTAPRRTLEVPPC